MSINIKNREAESLLDELKRLTGRGTSSIVLDLLRREAALQRRLRNQGRLERQIRGLARRYAKRAGAGAPPHEAVIGYDENGLPE